MPVATDAPLTEARMGRDGASYRASIRGPSLGRGGRSRSSSVTFYTIDVEEVGAGKRWTVDRRFNEFEELHRRLQAKGVHLRDMPKKSEIRRRFSSLFRDERQHRLGELLQDALRADPHLHIRELHTFLKGPLEPTPTLPEGTAAASAADFAPVAVAEASGRAQAEQGHGSGLWSAVRLSSTRRMAKLRSAEEGGYQAPEHGGYLQLRSAEEGGALPAPRAGARVGGQPRTFGLARVFVCGFFPTMLAGFGFYCQSVGLHYATYAYVHKYAMSESDAGNAKDFITLEDPVENMLGHQALKIGLMDTLAMAFPMVFGLATCCLAFCAGDVLKNKVLALWTKVMICAFLLFFLKGLLGACTTVPDSRGWQTCKEQSLVPEAVVWMREDHTFWDFLILDFWWVQEYGKPMRYCADMMFSGHTFVVTLFALGLYELARVLLSEVRETPARRYNCWRRAARILTLAAMGLVTVAQQGFEVYAVETSHFHYTSDVLMAFLVTLLLYSNGVICVAAETWTRCCKEVSGQHLLSFVGYGASTSGAALRHPEFEQHLHELRWREDADVESVFGSQGQLSKQDIDEWMRYAMDSKADVFVPPCCFPFCCMSGRHHVYTDQDVERILKQHALVSMRTEETPEKAALLYHYMDRQMREARSYKDGVTAQDVLDSLKCREPGNERPSNSSPLLSGAAPLSH